MVKLVGSEKLFLARWPLRSAEEIEAEMFQSEGEIQELIGEVVG